MEMLFWIALVFIFYTYIAYPIAVWLLAKIARPQHCDPNELSEWPTVTVVIAVHNEQQRVVSKIENLGQLNYPKDKLKILFVSDGSTDGSNEVIQRCGDIGLISYPERRGKAHALNRALEQVQSEIVVFTDVRQQLGTDAIRWLVARLLQNNIGAVSGELLHFDPSTNAAAQIGLYWRYEKWIRKSESAIASTAGVTGALYAIRKADYVPLIDHTVLDDFVEPMHIVRRGKRVLFEPNATITDTLQSDMSGERKRKTRTLTGNFQAFVQQPWLFLPWQNPIFIQFLSHKVFRLLVPYAMVLTLISSLYASGSIYSIAALLQIAFYTVALLGIFSHTLKRNRLISFAGVFVEMNWAAVVALGNFLSGQLNARWDKT